MFKINWGGYEKGEGLEEKKGCGIRGGGKAGRKKKKQDDKKKGVAYRWLSLRIVGHNYRRNENLGRPMTRKGSRWTADDDGKEGRKPLTAYEQTREFFALKNQK